MKTPSATLISKELTLPGFLNLLIVYIIWGSTYLAIRIAVREGAGFPPLTLGIARTITAATILLMWAIISKQRLKLTRQEWLVLVISGALLWTGGNGLVMIAEQRADSGLAALMIASAPIWVAILDAVLNQRLPSWQLITALVVGFSGIVLLSMPILQSGIQADIYSILALLGAAISWACGTVLQSRHPVEVSLPVSSSVQMLGGGVGFTILLLIFPEPVPQPTCQAWLAWGYLVVFGSLLAFTAYVNTLRMLPTKIVMTYSYVNPVIAVLLGWLILQEQISLWTIGGSVLVLLGVAGVFRERKHK
jgi:drug/metabolite transporter (DMT)-like permease